MLHISDTNSSTTPNQDERVLAALAHASAFIPHLYAIVPLFIWFYQRRKSRYVEYQAMQALIYQLAVIIFLYFATVVGMVIFIVAPSIISAIFPETIISAASITMGMLVFLIRFLLLVSYIFVAVTTYVYAIIGTIRAFQGRPFHYAIIGKRIERYIQKSSPVEQMQ